MRGESLCYIAYTYFNQHKSLATETAIMVVDTHLHGTLCPFEIVHGPLPNLDAFCEWVDDPEPLV